MQSELREVVNIFNEIANTSGKNDKIKIVKRNKDNDLFLECLKFLLDNDIVTGLSTKKINKKVALGSNKFDDILEVFDYIKSHNTGTDVDISVVKSYIEDNKDIEEFLIGLFTKGLKIGIDTKGVNKAIPKLIPEFNIMLADSYAKNTKRVEGKEFILSTKLDGSRICVIKHGDSLLLKTRQNKLYENLIEIEEDFKSLPDGVYDGELLAIGEFNDSAEQYKETMKRSRVKGIKKGLKMVCYDYIENVDDFYNGICKTKCIDRKNKLKEILSVGKQFIEYLEPLYIGKDIDKIGEFSNLAIQNKEEGIMCSIADAPYTCKRTKDLLKVKQFHDGDVLVTDVVEGDGRLKGTLGKIEVKFKYKGNIYTNFIGSGFNDDERNYYWLHRDEIINKVITIKYFEISKNKDGGYGFRFGTWQGKDYIRFDKEGIDDTNID